MPRYLLRVFFPSWRLFEGTGTSAARAEFRWTEAPSGDDSIELARWKPLDSAAPRRRWHHFIHNPDESARLARMELLERLLGELMEKEGPSEREIYEKLAERLAQSTSFKLIQTWAERVAPPEALQLQVRIKRNGHVIFRSSPWTVPPRPIGAPSPT